MTTETTHDYRIQRGDDGERGEARGRTVYEAIEAVATAFRWPDLDDVRAEIWDGAAWVPSVDGAS